MSKTGTPPQPVLAVDLDGTLLKSDMLHETFWNVASRDWSAALRTIGQLKTGKAALKRELAERASVDVAKLPYNAEVLDYIAAWRETGGQVALVTATDQSSADQIATHLGVFDAVFGSDGDRNLKGATKAEFLVERYGEQGFVYIGDHEADLVVWPHAAKAVTVNASETLRGKVARLGVEVDHIGTAERDLKPYAKALRPHQWLKNILVFIPLLLAHQLDATSLLRALTAFVAFSLTASSVYVLNDLLDLNADRAHARKCKRPFAAGTVPIGKGTVMAGGLLGIGAVLSAALGATFFFVMLSYYVMTTAYSLFFKRRAVIDVSVLAGLYTLRIVAGGVAVGVSLSMWLLAFSVFFFFALAAVKRQAELVDNIKAGKVQPEGRGYRNDDVEIISQMALGTGYVSILVLALYMNSPEVVLLYSNPPALWGICLILLFWISRIVLLTHRGEMHDDPIVFAVRDYISRLCGMMVVGFAVLGAVM
ncbi:UbiA family prenyltransferase [Celeribacter sp.]|uniref:UbiA family prenyltransferase n=1 Tax=Celeribacter sp. TaxID=1890673 RepID=UPI003A8C9C30